MCLIAFAIQPTPDWALLLASNRDESLSRPTWPLKHWITPRGTPVVGGRDGRDGGTWLAASGPGRTTARVAMLTNVRHGRDTARWPRSRGELPMLWLDGLSWDDLTGQLDPHAFGPFNLVVGDLDTGIWHWLTNRDAAHRVVAHTQALSPGVYGLSNAALDTPWPKTTTLRCAMEAAANSWSSTAEDALWDILANRHTWPDEQLPHTQVPWEWERALSAIWVDHPAPPGQPAHAGYGTRSSATLTVQVTGQHALHWQFKERTWRPEAQAGLRVLQWETPSA